MENFTRTDPLVTLACADVLKKDETTATNQKTILYQYHPIFQFTVGVCVALATVGMGINAF